MRSWDDAVEIADGTYTLYGWDYRNRLVTVTDFDSDDEQQQVVAYTYDMNNRLMSRTIQVEEGDPQLGFYVYDGNQMTLVLVGDGEGGGAVSHRLSSNALQVRWLATVVSPAPEWAAGSCWTTSRTVFKWSASSQ